MLPSLPSLMPSSRSSLSLTTPLIDATCEAVRFDEDWRSTRGEPQQRREGNGLRADEDITLAGFFARGCLILAGRNLPQGAGHADGRHVSWRTLDRKTPTVTWKDHST